MKKNILFLLLFLLLTNEIYSQISEHCGEVRISYSPFDSLIQKEFMGIKSDSILVLNHTYGGNGSKKFALFCWKDKGKYSFKLIKKINEKIKVIEELPYYLKGNTSAFFEEKLYTIDVPVTGNIYIDDGKCASSVLVYYSNSYCWRVHVESGNKSHDNRVKWVNIILETIYL